MITIGKITDQILKLYSGGDPSDDKELSRGDIKLLVGQVINKILKTEFGAVSLQMGENIPPHTLITTYVVPVTAPDSDGTPHGYANAKLPVYPISLPRNMGIWSITDQADKDDFIPIANGQNDMLSSQEATKLLEGNVSYWAEGRMIYFGKDITISPHNISTVRIKLLVVDPSQLGEYDYLAIPADLQDQIIKEVLVTIGAIPPTSDKVSDSNNMK